MRLSLALRVPKLDFDQRQFKKLMVGLNANFPQATVEKMDHLSIPLLQLGDMGQGTFMGMYQQLKEIALEHSCFELKLQGLWAYPHQSEADMLWIGVQNSKELRALQQELAEFLVLDESSLVKPHIPLVHLHRSSDVTNLISPFKKFDFGRVEIEEVAFMEKLSGRPHHRFVGSYHLTHDSSSG